MTDRPVLVVLGTDSDGKPHASIFANTDQDLVLKAAALMNYRVVAVSDPELAKLAATLPAGRMFATGKGFVPLVKRDTYDRLAALLGTEAELQLPPAPSDDTATQPTATGPNDAGFAPEADVDPWAAIEVGTMVLAKDAEAEAWFEAVVKQVSSDGDLLRLRWRDYPNEREISVKRRAVAIISS